MVFKFGFICYLSLTTKMSFRKFLRNVMNWQIFSCVFKLGFLSPAWAFLALPNKNDEATAVGGIMFYEKHNNMSNFQRWIYIAKLEVRSDLKTDPG